MVPEGRANPIMSKSSSAFDVDAMGEGGGEALVGEVEEEVWREDDGTTRSSSDGAAP